ncbi:MAG: hypothetical protein C0425_08835 [Chlorobiaceae bacterium]|nr:hypothetical protein [Chlorobiaceae bacterium]MBA4310427.1 hypothetical protein [Chlorobiaceae bacterium]
MRKLALLSLVLIFGLIGCGKKEEPIDLDKQAQAFDSTDLQTKPITDVTEYAIKYNLVKGNEYLFRLTTITDNLQTIQADTTISENVKQTITYLYNIRVKEIEQDGTFELNFAIKSINLVADANGKKFTFRSGQVLDSLDRERFAEYEAFTGQSFDMRMKPNGELIEIFRVDKIADNFLKLRKIEQPLSENEKKLFQQDLINGVLRTFAMQVFRKLPENVVAIDSSWQLPQPPLNMQIFELKNIQTYRLNSFEKYNDDVIAKIDAGIISSAVINPEAKKNNINVKQPSFNADGVIFFNITKGVVQRSRTRTSLIFEVSMPMPTPTGNINVKRKQSMTNLNVLELLEIKKAS